MNLRMILSAALLVLIIINLIMYGYLVWTVKTDTTAGVIVTTKPMLFYSPIIVHLLQFITSGLLVYQR